MDVTGFAVQARERLRRFSYDHGRQVLLGGALLLSAIPVLLFVAMRRPIPPMPVLRARPRPPVSVPAAPPSAPAPAQSIQAQPAPPTPPAPAQPVALRDSPYDQPADAPAKPRIDLNAVLEACGNELGVLCHSVKDERWPAVRCLRRHQDDLLPACQAKLNPVDDDLAAR